MAANVHFIPRTVLVSLAVLHKTTTLCSRHWTGKHTSVFRFYKMHTNFLKFCQFTTQSTADETVRISIQSSAINSSLGDGRNGIISLGSNETVVQCQVGSTLLPDEVLDCTQIHVGVKYLQHTK